MGRPPPARAATPTPSSAMSAAARERESRPAADCVYCLRATRGVRAPLVRARREARARSTTRRSGTGPGSPTAQRGGEWLVATNHHVVDFPEVTGDGQELEGVPAGVAPGPRGGPDRHERGGAGRARADRAADPVVADEALDIAVLASREPLARHPVPARALRRSPRRQRRARARVPARRVPRRERGPRDRRSGSATSSAAGTTRTSRSTRSSTSAARGARCSRSRARPASRRSSASTTRATAARRG